MKTGSVQDFPSPGALIKRMVLHVIGQVRTYKQSYPGMMHALIFWGMTLLAAGHLISLMQMQLVVPLVELPFPRGQTYLVFELLSDLAGIFLLAGVSMAAFRRIVQRPAHLTSTWEDYYALIILGLIALMGYVNEGLRLLASSPPWADWSPLGSLAAKLLAGLGITAPTAAVWHPVLVWSHISIGLVFLASIPFTKLRHVIFTPLYILIHPDRKQGTLETINNIETADILGVGKITEFTRSQLLSFEACVQCGRCECACPVAASGIDFSPTKFIRTLHDEVQALMVSANGHNGHTGLLNSQNPWACTTCGICSTNCPAFIDPVPAIIDLRRHQVLMEGRMPKSAGETLRNLERQGNPWGMPPQERTGWSAGLNIRLIQPGDPVDVLFFPGCSLAFDERNKKIARAVVQLFMQQGIDFAILGPQEGCCGESARRLGDEYSYQVTARRNIELLNTLSFNRVVTSCPHCLNTIKNEYPQLGGDFEAAHVTQLLDPHSLPIRSQTGMPHEMVTYHDPCYLGRCAGEYDAPRKLLQAAGVDLVELPLNRENSFCCGGGGGQMWLESEGETRINKRRLDQVIHQGAHQIATACPYCLSMFEDAVRSAGKTETVKVMDVAEILLAGMESSSKPENIPGIVIGEGVL